MGPISLVEFSLVSHPMLSTQVAGLANDHVLLLGCCIVSISRLRRLAQPNVRMLDAVPAYVKLSSVIRGFAARGSRGTVGTQIGRAHV